MAITFMEAFDYVEDKKMQDETAELISAVLHYLAEKEGGEIVIGELQLKADARCVINKEDGLITIVALPESVRAGIDAAEAEAKKKRLAEARAAKKIADAKARKAKEKAEKNKTTWTDQFKFTPVPDPNTGTFSYDKLGTFTLEWNDNATTSSGTVPTFATGGSFVGNHSISVYPDGTVNDPLSDKKPKE